MTLYEGIALIQEKQAVVLDLGYEYTKFGFTGEPAPRCIVKSEFWCTKDRKLKRVFRFESSEELYDNLVHMMHLLYFRHLLVNPKERKVIVVESLFTPTLFRETLAKVLYTHYEVSGVVWADSGRMCALTLGVPVALVVELGFREAEVAAVAHACVVLHAAQAEPLAGRAVHDELARLLDEDNCRKLNLPDHVIEDIKVKACFVVDRERSEKWLSDIKPAQARCVQFPVGGEGGGGGGVGGGGGSVVVSGRTRELAAEVLFRRDNEFSSLPEIILHCIMMSPIDIRRQLAANILVTGGCANIPGLKARLASELRYLVTQSPYQEVVFVREFAFHSAPCPDNACAWTGGSLYGAADGGAGGSGPPGAGAGVAAGGAGAGGVGGGGGRAPPRAPAARRPPDWVCLLDNTPAQHPHRQDFDI